MKPGRRYSGFTLVTAIFLLAVVASLAVYMTNIRVVQQTTVVYGLQGARAIQAARSGMEWGIARAIMSNSCVGSTTFTNAAFAGFSVEVQCSQTTHTEGVVTFNTYLLDSIASSGTYGSLDYVQRHLQASVSRDPP